MLKQLIFLLPIVVTLHAFAQDSTDDEKKIGRRINDEITMDFTTGTISPNTLPFDVPFILKGEVAKEVTRIRLKIINKKYQCDTGDCANECLSCEDAKAKQLRDLLTAVEYPEAQRALEIERIRKGPGTTTPEADTAKVRALQGETNSTTINRLTAQIVMLRTELETKAVRKKLTAPCSCGECKTYDFSTCYEVCPWEATFMSREVKDEDTINHFSLNIPPLQANEHYQFFFYFERSVTGERAKLDELMIPILSDHYFDEFRTGPVTFTNKGDLQVALRDAVYKYYADTELVSVDFMGSPLHSADIDGFHTILRTETVNTKDLVTLMNDQKTSRREYETLVADAQRRWKELFENNIIVQLKAKLSVLTDQTAEEKAILSKLNKVDITDQLKSNFAGGRRSLADPFNDLDELAKVQDPAQVDKYVDNLKELLTHWQEIQALIVGVNDSPEQRLHIYLTSAEKKIYEDLTAKETLTAAEQRQLDALKENGRTDIETLKTTLIPELIESLMKIKDKLKTHKDDLVNFEKYFRQVAAKVFAANKLNSSAPLTTTADFVTRTGYYITADAGFAYIFFGRKGTLFPNEIQPYYGANFHLGPINRQAEYSLVGCSFRRNWYKSISVIVGITVNSLADSGRRKDGLDSKSLLNGIGIRVLEPVRISVGGVWVKVTDPNPLIARDRLKMYPYLSVSLDLDVQKYIGKIAELFPK